MSTPIPKDSMRSRIMRAVRRKGTEPELSLRSLLHRRGLRYRINLRGLPGSPDVVFTRWKIAIFVHGCFWHRHEGCSLASVPSHNGDYWNAKFKENVSRDTVKNESLRDAGWKVIIVWQCELKKDPDQIVRGIVNEVAEAKERAFHER
jgi:DNA mismatch endonuclease, patch repair protein